MDCAALDARARRRSAAAEAPDVPFFLAGIELTLPVVLGAFLALFAVRAATGWQRDVLLCLGFADRVRERIVETSTGVRPAP